jgi:putative acetyltransferase
MISNIAIRPVRDEDSPDILGILAAVFAEYPGCILELSEVPELARPATSFAEMGGSFWAADREGQLLGFVAMVPDGDGDGLFELKKLYLRRDARGNGLGRRLIDLVEAEVRRRGGSRVHLWTDTRFETAHRVYERCGYQRQPGTRDLHDVSNSVEYHYLKKLVP